MNAKPFLTPTFPVTVSGQEGMSPRNVVSWLQGLLKQTPSAATFNGGIISVLIQDNVIATKKGERSVFLYFRVDVGIDRKDVGDDVQVNSHQFVA